MKMIPKRTNLTLGALLAVVAAHADHPYLYLDYEDADSCMLCHWSPMGGTNAVDLEEIMGSIHWTWETQDAHTQLPVGKINIINNYCVAVPSNEPRCTSCHIGVCWKDNTFDHSDGSKIDCLVCHDGTGTYKKVPTGAGAPVPGLDYKEILRNLQKPDRNNCGTCHFYGGGGDAVKHGSLDSTMANPPRSVDVHMGSLETGGLNMVCTDCHVAEPGTHNIIGSRYSKNYNDATLCRDCHESQLGEGESIHGDNLFLGFHIDRVACQTCHIPAMARGGKDTKMFWDWSTAGEKTPEGGILQLFDERGNNIYDTRKGSFEWEGNVPPEYAWSNGNVRHVTLDDTFMQGQVVKINKLEGSRTDPNSLIFPVKRFSAIQPYDAMNGNLAIPNLFPFPSDTDTDAYWKSYDWGKALASGMAYVGREFSGEVGFIASEMYWIQNHMVAPKEDALKCFDCHSTHGQLEFAKLGYRSTQAKSLQTLYQYMVWAGYEVIDDAWVDSGSWLGMLYIWNEPWIFSMLLDKYLYIPEAAVTPSGGWIYWPETSDWSEWTPIGGGWYYAPQIGKFVYVPGDNISVQAGWTFVPA